MASEAQETPLLQGKPDDYGGVKVNLTEPMTTEEFVAKLRASLVVWRSQGKKGIWIKLADGLENLIAPAKAQGFVCHHAEKEYTMLTSWLDEESPNTLPANASHRIGVGAFILNKNREVLVVQETSGYFKDKDVWKLPTGVIKEGEGIAEGAIREVEEETGIKTEFVEVLAFREAHKAFSEYRKTDIMFLCELKTNSFEIKKQDSEILAAKWMPIEEYVHQPFHTKKGKETFMLMAKICLERSEVKTLYEGFSSVNSVVSEKRSLYCSTVHANSLNMSPDDQAFTSTST
ncbi:hypothetical protein CARUB_v10014311mg [Capsella rubella]|uniref:Nudix hydrolase n=1 Tax=Capsella rubella TaxID=81985 RepID=R0G6C6_9BRAS|nr:nudix hydrolase 6 [Capsella rubella]EOA31147.1 hypothetical protein CARUB_v10014311mg [Capsella rubella]